MKNVIRIANPAAVMSGVLDLFLAQPFGSRSLLQRMFSMTLSEGIKSFQKPIDALVSQIDDQIISEKLKTFVDADESIKTIIREEAENENVDIVVAILRSELIDPEMTHEQVGKIFNAYVAWNNAVENVGCSGLYSQTLLTVYQVDDEMKQGAEWFAYLKQVLKLYTRQRDKAMMLNMIEEVRNYILNTELCF